MVQWFRICLPMQGTRVRSLIRELRSYMPRDNWAHVPKLEKPVNRNGRPHMPQLRPSSVKKKKKEIIFFKECDLIGSNCSSVTGIFLKLQHDVLGLRSECHQCWLIIPLSPYFPIYGMGMITSFRGMLSIIDKKCKAPAQYMVIILMHFPVRIRLIFNW